MLGVGCFPSVQGFNARIFRGILSMTPGNIEHRTSNTQPAINGPIGNHWLLDVGCWVLDVFLRVKNFSGDSFHDPLEHRTSNIQHPTPNRQSMAQLETIGCWMLDVGCWMFSFGSWVQCAKFSGNSLPPNP